MTLPTTGESDQVRIKLASVEDKIAGIRRMIEDRRLAILMDRVA